jgi:hypothetical protein
MNRVTLNLSVLTGLVVMSGCSEPAASELSAMEPLQEKERLAEVEVGAFRIPLVAVDQRQGEEEYVPDRNALLLRFQLFVLVPPHHESDVAGRIHSHGARLREEVIRTCRKATLEELDEPELVTLKSELRKVLGRYFGPEHLRQVVVTNVLLEPT